MNKSPWKTENRFVSPWNYFDDVVKDYQQPERVKIHDVTLRDRERQAGINTVLGGAEVNPIYSADFWRACR